MKKINKLPLHITVLCLLLTLTGLSVLAQSKFNPKEAAIETSAEPEKRPFDFDDKFYNVNGIEPSRIQNRRTGNDDYSVFDTSSDIRFNNVRIISTLPAYNSDGAPLFFTYLGDLNYDGFMETEEGQAALEAAERLPLYVFPSSSSPGMDRQAALFDTRSYTPEENPLSLSIVVKVAFNVKDDSIWTNELIVKLLEKNGESLDGTPIVRSMDDMQSLIIHDLVTLEIKGDNEPSESPYTIAPIILDPTGGAIELDAYLRTVMTPDGSPLKNEAFFWEMFDCLKLKGRYCG